jgi:hypothetical protein
MHPLRIAIVLVLVLAESATSQTNHGPISFGVEFGLLSNVRIAYSPLTRFEIQVGTGSALPSSDSYVENICASLAYVFSDEPTAAIVRLSGYATNVPDINGITSIELGVRHYLSQSVSSYAFIGPGLAYETFDNPFGILTCGVGVTVHLP